MYINLPVNEWASANAVRGQPFTRPNGEVLNPTYSSLIVFRNTLGLEHDPWNFTLIQIGWKKYREETLQPQDRMFRSLVEMKT